MMNTLRSSSDREAFIKGQVISVQKALNKNEVPLKQKHARNLIVGTHKERSSSIFWNTISRIQLEKNPVITWKFCHLLHKLIRDGHPQIISESSFYAQRVVQLGNFWQHLHSSGYGRCNTHYCRMLVDRLFFHQRNNFLPGNLNLSSPQVVAMVNADFNQTFELSVEMLDQMDNLLSLQVAACSTMDVVSWSSLIPQGQCLLAPLILVIVDTSKFYDYLVKMIFKLHSRLPADALAGHRERFNDIFVKVKKFYEEAAKLQYFKFLVSIPPLPAVAPNFLQASDLDTYQSPHAFLHADNISECDTPPDLGECLVDVSDDLGMQNNIENTNQFLTEIQLMNNARMANVMPEARQSCPRYGHIVEEARSYCEQCEHEMMLMASENQENRLLIDELKIQLEALQATNISLLNGSDSSSAKVEDIEKRAQCSEQNFQKMKAVYSNLRKEHIDTLVKLAAAQKESEACNAESDAKGEEMSALRAQLEDLREQKRLLQEKAHDTRNSYDEMEVKLFKYEVDCAKLNKLIEEKEMVSIQRQAELESTVGELEAKIDELSGRKLSVEEQLKSTAHELQVKCADSTGNLNRIDSLMKKMESIEEEARIQIEAHENNAVIRVDDTKNQLFISFCKAYENVLRQSADELQNAASITYPMQLCLPSIRTLIESMEGLASLIDDGIGPQLIHSLAMFSHGTAGIIVSSAAAAYSASIQHFEPIQEQCRHINSEGIDVFICLQSLDLKLANDCEFPKLKASLEKLEQLLMSLPASNDYDKDAVDLELENEMHQVDTIIKKAVTLIDEMQTKSRSKESGIRLEVNEKVLDCCNKLMNAIIVLVQRSRAMQEEIIDRGRGSASSSDYYKRNHQWTEGLISAAKSVGVAAMFLVQSADGVVNGQGKLELLIVAAQEIAASTAQLFVSSRVKADRDSNCLAELSVASRDVNSCTANVVATTKTAQTTLSVHQNIDFSHLTLHETKKEEMESQVLSLELEAKLNKERARLAELRKRHYHLASQENV